MIKIEVSKENKDTSEKYYPRTLYMELCKTYLICQLKTFTNLKRRGDLDD